MHFHYRQRRCSSRRLAQCVAEQDRSYGSEMKAVYSVRNNVQRTEIRQGFLQPIITVTVIL